LRVFTVDNGYYLLAVDPKCFPLINIKIVSLLGPRTRWQHLRSRAAMPLPQIHPTMLL